MKPLYYVFPGIEIPKAAASRSEGNERVNAQLKFLPTRAEMEFIVELVATERGCKVKDITGPSRKFYDATTRHMVMKLFRETFLDRRQGVHHRLGTKLIGKVLGYRDHSTVVNGLKSFANLYETESDMRDAYHVIQHKVIKAIRERRKMMGEIATGMLTV